MDITAAVKRDQMVEVPFGGGAFVTLRFVSREELREIYKLATKVTLDENEKETRRYDGIEGDVLLGNAAVRGWRGFLVDGQELPYSKENCELLMRNSAEFAQFVNATCSTLMKMQVRKREEEVKNSLGTSAGAQTVQG